MPVPVSMFTVSVRSSVTVQLAYSVLYLEDS